MVWSLLSWYRSHHQAETVSIFLSWTSGMMKLLSTTVRFVVTDAALAHKDRSKASLASFPLVLSLFPARNRYISGDLSCSGR